MNQEKIGKLIAKMRKEKGLTQQALGDKVGVGYRAVSKWETGQTLPDISIIKELSEILGITADELLKGELKPENKINKHSKNKLLFLIPIIIIIALIIIYLKNNPKEYEYTLITSDINNYVEGKATIRGKQLTLQIDNIILSNYRIYNAIIKNYQYKIFTNDKLILGFGYDSEIENLTSPISVQEFLQNFTINYRDEVNIPMDEIVNNNLILEFNFIDEEDNIINKQIEISLIPVEKDSQPDK